MAGAKRLKATKEFNSLVGELAQASKDKLKEIPKILALMSETSAEMVNGPKPEILFPKEVEPLDLRNPEKIPEGTIIQNRDRSGVGSIAQMRKIASNPDYLRMSGNNSFGEGAPVIAYGNIPASQLGKISEAYMPDGSRIKVQNAVIDVNEILTSTDIDGQHVTEFYSDDASKPRAIAGNGRLTGLKEAYKQGTATEYRKAFLEDSSTGISSKVIEKVSNPVLVRVMQPKDVTSDIGDKSNTRSNISMSKVETARNDNNRLEANKFPLNSSGAPTVDALNEFIGKLPLTEQAALIDNERKQPNLECEQRLMNAMFINAYDVKIAGKNNAAVADHLLSTKVESIDPDDRVITGALYIAAPTIGRLKGLPGGYDIRDIIVRAAYNALNAKHVKGSNIKTQAQNMDMFEGEAVTGATALIMNIFAENKRSSRRCAESLIKISNALIHQAQEVEDSKDSFFGEADALPPDVVIRNALKRASEGDAQMDSVAGQLLTERQRAFWDSAQAFILLNAIVNDTKTLSLNLD